MKTRRNRRKGGSKGLKATVLLLLAQATHGSGIWESILSGKRLSDDEVQKAATQIVNFAHSPSVSYPDDFDPLPVEIQEEAVAELLSANDLATVAPTVTPYVAELSSKPPESFNLAEWSYTPGAKYRVAVKPGKEDVGFDPMTVVEYVGENKDDYIVKKDGVDYPLAKDSVDLLPPIDFQTAWGRRRRRRTVRRRKTLRRKM